MDIVERLRSHWGGERIADVSIDVADAADEIERLRIRNDKVKNKWKESTLQFKVWKKSFWSEERKAADKIETLTHELAKAKVEIERLLDEIYNLKLAVAGGEDAPGSANLVGPEDVIMWRKLWADEIERAIQEIKQLRLANSDLQMHYDYAKTECDKLRSEVLRLSGSLAFISMLTPLDGQSWESHAKFITAYALEQLKETE